MKTQWAHSFTWALFFVLFPALALGQQQTAEITGRIIDASGAVVPGATVTVTNTSIGIARSVASDSQGEYVVPLLPPARDYQIKVASQGFKEAVRQGIGLDVAQVARVDITMEVGAVTQSVNVVSAAPLLESQTSSVGQIMTTRSIDDLPLNGRSSFRLVQLTPGVVFNAAAYGQFGDVPVNTTFDATLQINGGRMSSNEYLIDGVPSSAGYFSQMTVIPDVDDTQEFRVQGNDLPATYGRFGGGVVNVITKSGTNDLHGTLFEFLRNRSLNASDFFSNQAGKTKPRFEMNQFGGALGGPVIIPHIYDGKGKTFFFGDFQATRRVQGEPTSLTVPTALQREGNFSQTYNSSGQLVVIYDPFSTAVNPSNPSQYIRQAFPNNIISPTEALNPVAQNLMTWYPLPNTAGSPYTAANNFVVDPRLIVRPNVGSFRIDQNVTNRYRLFGRYSTSDAPLTQPNSFGNEATPNPGAVGTTFFHNNTFALSNIYTISPTAMLNVSYGFARWYQIRQTLSFGFNDASLGFPASLASQIQVPMFPTFSPSSYTGTNGQSYFVNGNDGHTLLVSLTKVRGRQTLTAGTDIRMHRINQFQVSNGGGSFSFALAQTQGPNPNVATSTAGNSIASLLLGFGSSGSVPYGSGTETQDWYFAGYLQDDIQVTHKLKVNVGLRWDAETPYNDRHNRLAYFNSTISSPAANSQFPNLEGGLEFAGVGPTGRDVYSTKHDNFGPRVGFAYSPTTNWVVRSGFAVTFAPLEITSNNTSFAPNQGYSNSTSWVTSLNGLVPDNLLNNPFPTGLIQPTGNTLGASTLLGQSLTGSLGVWDPNPKQPYTLEWNFDIQRQLPGQVLIDVAYVGTRGIHLTSPQDLDALNPSYLSMGTGLQTLVPNPFQPFVTSGTLAASTVTQRQLLLPFPQYTDVSEVNSTWGSSTYNSLQLKASKRMPHGVTLLAAYTISKEISDVNAMEGDNSPSAGSSPYTTPQNAYDLRAEYSASEENIPEALVVSALYQLPFGPGQRFLAKSNGAVARLVGGWQAVGALTEQVGAPLAITTTVTDGGDRPNSTGINPNLSTSRPLGQKVLEWFNRSAFSQPAPFTFGDVSRTIPNLLGPGLHNLDVSLIKDTRLNERFDLEFHAEAFNVANTPHFWLPDTNEPDSTFGEVSATYLNPRQFQFALKLNF